MLCGNARRGVRAARAPSDVGCDQLVFGLPQDLHNDEILERSSCSATRSSPSTTPTARTPPTTTAPRRSRSIPTFTQPLPRRRVADRAADQRAAPAQLRPVGVSRRSRRRSTSARPRRARSCGSPGARSRGSARSRACRSTSRSSRRARRRGTGAGAPSAGRCAGTPRSPAAWSASGCCRRLSARCSQPRRVSCATRSVSRSAVGSCRTDQDRLLDVERVEHAPQHVVGRVARRHGPRAPRRARPRACAPAAGRRAGWASRRRRRAAPTWRWPGRCCAGASRSTTSGGSSPVEHLVERREPGADALAAGRRAWTSRSCAGSGPRRPSRRTSHGSVEPWISSVPAATTSAISTSTSRCGVSSGRTNTAASVTAPRMPAHADDRRRSAGGGDGSLRAIDGTSQRQVRRREHPDEPEHDHRQPAPPPRRRPSGRSTATSRRGRGGSTPDLQPDEEEHRVLEQELDGGPVAALHHPRRRRLDDVRLVAEQQPGDHHRQHPRGVDLLGDEVHGERAQQRHGRVGDDVVDVPAELGEQDRRDDARRRTPPTADSRKSPATSSSGDGADDRGDRRAQAHDRGRVVDEALALQDRHDPPRHADPAGDRGGRDRVRRGDHGAERQRRAASAIGSTSHATSAGTEHR